MNAAGSFANMVPGFDFLQGLMKEAGAAVPGMGQWIAPTLDPEEVGKRIEELKTVQFWLEQNARMLGATIQALEVQRMTLSTLKAMNVPAPDVADALKIKPSAETAPPSAAKRPAKPARASASASAPAPGVADPMQWWGALTQQFTELAARTLRDSATEAAAKAPPAKAPPPAPATKSARPARARRAR